MYSLLYHPRAAKRIEKFPADIKSKILARLEKLAESPFLISSLDVKKMGGTDNAYRLRVGGVRIIYEVFRELKKIYILDIDWRGNIY